LPPAGSPPTATSGSSETGVSWAGSQSPWSSPDPRGHHRLDYQKTPGAGRGFLPPGRFASPDTCIDVLFRVLPGNPVRCSISWGVPNPASQSGTRICGLMQCCEAGSCPARVVSAASLVEGFDVAPRSFLDWHRGASFRVFQAYHAQRKRHETTAERADVENVC